MIYLIYRTRSRMNGDCCRGIIMEYHQAVVSQSGVYSPVTCLSLYKVDFFMKFQYYGKSKI